MTSIGCLNCRYFCGRASPKRLQPPKRISRPQCTAVTNQLLLGKLVSAVVIVNVRLFCFAAPSIFTVFWILTFNSFPLETDDNPAERGQQATSYPSLISGIYNSVQQMLRLHLDCCLSMPPDVRAKIEQLKLSCSSRGGRKQYWIDSAKRLGLVDTPHGIHFTRDPHGPLPPLSGPSVNSKENRKRKAPKPKKATPAKPVEEPQEEPKAPPPVDSRPLVFPSDKPLISDYLYLTLEQMAPCTLVSIVKFVTERRS